MIVLPRVFVCVAAIVAAFGVARAEGKICTSILEGGEDCAPLPRVTAKGDLRVEVITRKRSVTYPLSAAKDLDEDLTSSCPGGKCGCDEHVQYFDFKGPVPGFRQVNAFEMRAAAGAKCSIENSNVAREAMHFAVSAHFISTATYQLEYCHGCGGSCHGTTVLATYDAQSGKALHLRDILKAGAGDALASQLADDFVQSSVDAPERAWTRAQLVKELSARPLLDEGFYVENGRVYANLDSFATSCAAGSFFPVPVRADMIDPAVAAAIKNSAN